jgi:hypothetical protein
MIRSVTSDALPHGICSACRSIGHCEVAEILARKLRGPLVFGADVTGRYGARAEQRPIEIEMGRTHFAHRFGLTIRHISADPERQGGRA